MYILLLLAQRMLRLPSLLSNASYKLEDEDERSLDTLSRLLNIVNLRNHSATLRRASPARVTCFSNASMKSGPAIRFRSSALMPRSILSAGSESVYLPCLARRSLFFLAAHPQLVMAVHRPTGTRDVRVVRTVDRSQHC